MRPEHLVLPFLPPLISRLSRPFEVGRRGSVGVLQAERPLGHHDRWAGNLRPRPQGIRLRDDRRRR